MLPLRQVPIGNQLIRQNTNQRTDDDGYIPDVDDQFFSGRFIHEFQPTNTTVGRNKWRANGFELSSPLSTSTIHYVLRKLARFPGPLQRMVSEPNLANSLQNMLDQHPEWSNLGMVQLEF